MLFRAHLSCSFTIQWELWFLSANSPIVPPLQENDMKSQKYRNHKSHYWERSALQTNTGTFMTPHHPQCRQDKYSSHEVTAEVCNFCSIASPSRTAKLITVSQTFSIGQTNMTGNHCRNSLIFMLF